MPASVPARMPADLPASDSGPDPKSAAGASLPCMSQVNVRPVEVCVHTDEFRVVGLAHLRPATGMAWLLNAEDRPHLPMTRVAMYRAGIEEPPAAADLVYESHFAAIPKSSVVWVQGGAGDDVKAGLGHQPRGVYLVFPTYVLSGALAMRPEMRLSDYVGMTMTKKSFVTVNGVRVLGLGGRGTPFTDLPVVRVHDAVTVDLRKVAAVFDARGGDPATAYGLDG